jgi:hypothetical protein
MRMQLKKKTAEWNVNRCVWQYREKKMSKRKKKEIKVLKDARKKGTSIVNQYKAGIKATTIKEKECSAAVEYSNPPPPPPNKIHITVYDQYMSDYQVN